jgi:hypothetical protein
LNADRAPQLKAGVRHFYIGEMMLGIPKLISSVFLILVLTRFVDAKEWRGIVPLHSTRADVEKLLGPQLPPPTFNNTRMYNLNSSWAIYFLPEGEVWFNFVDEKHEHPNCLGVLPHSTVLSITIEPNRKMTLSDIGIDPKKAKLFNGSNLKGFAYKGYLDKANGMAVILERGEIYNITYIGAAKDRNLCPTYFHNLKRFALLEMYYDR